MGNVVSGLRGFSIGLGSGSLWSDQNRSVRSLSVASSHREVFSARMDTVEDVFDSLDKCIQSRFQSNCKLVMEKFEAAAEEARRSNRHESKQHELALYKHQLQHNHTKQRLEKVQRQLIILKHIASFSDSSAECQQSQQIQELTPRKMQLAIHVWGQLMKCLSVTVDFDEKLFVRPMAVLEVPACIPFHMKGLQELNMLVKGFVPLQQLRTLAGRASTQIRGLSTLSSGNGSNQTDANPPARSFALGQLIIPSDLALHPRNGQVFVTESGSHRIHVFSPMLKPIRVFGSYGRNPGQLMRPSQLEFSVGGTYLLVLDKGNNCVRIYDSAHGLYLRTICSRSDMLYDMLYPVNVRVDPFNTIYILDSRNSRIARYSMDGTMLGFIGGPDAVAPIGHALSMCILDNGFVCVLLSDRDGILVLRPDGSPVVEIYRPRELYNVAQILRGSDNSLLAVSHRGTVLSVTLTEDVFSLGTVGGLCRCALAQDGCLYYLQKEDDSIALCKS
eukprot:TRINITY_DN5263_c0_g1_i1.p1 TRINITY_DN5263_c0_g1~~TRINITY_DN5263_c0_g1_i1.p1  ORF type:complete len:502 (-),score=96.41 TRINITY_DN5263_c0_g1_i1:162-1667(-)